MAVFNANIQDLPCNAALDEHEVTGGCFMSALAVHVGSQLTLTHAVHNSSCAMHDSSHGLQWLSQFAMLLAAHGGPLAALAANDDSRSLQQLSQLAMSLSADDGSRCL